MKLFRQVICSFLMVLGGAPVFSATVKLGDEIKSEKDVTKLIGLRKAQDANQWPDCVRLADQLLGLEDSKSELAFTDPNSAWFVTKKLQCSNKILEADKSKMKSYGEFIRQIWARYDELRKGGHSRSFRKAFSDGVVLVLEREVDGSVNEKTDSTWKLLYELIDGREILDTSTLAKVYRLAGDMGYNQKKFELAREFYERSLRSNFNSELQRKVEDIYKKLNMTRAAEPAASSSASSILSSESENKLFAQVASEIKNKNWVKATEFGVELIQAYPGGKKSETTAKNIFNIYAGLAGKEDKKSTDLKNKVLDIMSRADGQRLYDWAQTMSNREHFLDAARLAQTNVQNLKGQALATQILMLAAQSAYNAASFKEARELYETVMREHSGTKSASAAAYRLALLCFRDGQYDKADELFGKFLQSEHFSDFELSSLYWRWRSQQILKKPEAKEMARRLIDRYPLSYYGLRARAELAGGKLKFDSLKSENQKWSFVWTPFEERSWENFVVFKMAGWREEAQLELAQISEPTSAQGKLLHAYLWSLADDYYKASEILSRALSMDTSLFSIEALRVAYPASFFEEISREAKKYELPPEIVMSLIKQESSFRTDVKSPAGAIGLMQLMPATAREVARDMRLSLPNGVHTDLQNPDKNIRLGTQYLFRRLKSFDQHVPLALASYNAGIGNIRNWLRARQDLADLSKTISSEPKDELWVDELPWSETSGYVKSILRNYLVYLVLDKGEWVLTDPTWKFELAK